MHSELASNELASVFQWGRIFHVGQLVRLRDRAYGTDTFWDTHFRRTPEYPREGDQAIILAISETNHVEIEFISGQRIGKRDGFSILWFEPVPTRQHVRLWRVKWRER